MNAENFSKWQLRQGHEVIRTKSSYWYEASPHVFQAFPYHWVINPSEKELNDVIREHGIYALRYSTPLDSSVGKISYHVIQKRPYSMDNLQKKTRKYLKDGLNQFTVEQITLSNLAAKGWQIEKDTLERQGRLSSMSQTEWELLCHSAEGLEGFEAWGASINGNLASCLLTTRIDGIGYTLYSLTDQKYLDMHASKVIFYIVTSKLFEDEGINSIFYTMQSLDAPDSIDIFKFRMGFQPNPVRQRVVFHPLLKPFINSLSHKLINYSLRLFPENSILPKAEGMIRFYREGNMPVNKQVVPDCVDLPKDYIFTSPII